MSSNTNNSDNNNNKIPLIFIHGIKGSTLVDEQEKLYYLNFWQAISLSSPQIALPLEWKDGKQKTDGLKAGKILDKVAYVKVYGPFLDYLKTLGRPIYPFAYDWRRDLNETVEKFQTFIRKVYADHNCKVQLVAHSMGGLVTLASINTHHGVLVGEPVTNLPDRDNVQPKSGDPETVATQSEVEQGESSEKKQTTNFVSENVKKGDERIIDIVHSVVYAGCPFRTGVGFLRDLMVGTPTGYNNKILSPSVLYTFPSLYTFFPTDENSQILDENENFVPINFYDYQDWVNYKMGIFYHVSKPTEEQLEHVRYCTIQAKLLRSKLVALKDVNYPPCAVLASHKHVTERRYKRVNEKLDFSAPITAMGDDRIVNALPPDGIQCKEYETDEAHAGLLNDIPKTNQIISDLLSIVQ